MLDWLAAPEQTGLRRAFTVWFNRVLLPRKAPDTDFTEFNDLNEVNTMLAETVKRWTQDWEQQGIVKGMEKGRQEGRQEGRQQEAAKLFLVLLEAKFGDIAPQIRRKVDSASPEQIEIWSRRLFQAATPEVLFDR